MRGSWYRPVAGAATLVGVESTVDRHPPLDPIDGTVDRGFVAICARTVAERFPVMAGASFRGGWAGPFMESPDERPVVGPLAPYAGLYTVAGDSGTSFKTAPAIGLGLAELILDGAAHTVDLAPFSADRFAPGHRGAAFTVATGTVSR